VAGLQLLPLLVLSLAWGAVADDEELLLLSCSRPSAMQFMLVVLALVLLRLLLRVLLPVANLGKVCSLLLLL
jgi:hypothetical protein